MDADLIAALERQSLRMLISSKQDGDDYERIRAHIETLRNGGERAQIVAWLRGIRRLRDTEHLADAIEAGAPQGGN